MGLDPDSAFLPGRELMLLWNKIADLSMSLGISPANPIPFTSLFTAS